MNFFELCELLSSEKTSLPEFFCSASLCEASKKITGNGFFSTFVTQLDSKFWPGFASQKSRSSFALQVLISDSCPSFYQLCLKFFAPSKSLQAKDFFTSW